MKRLFFLTGQSGVGKSTVLRIILDKLKTDGFTVGGMLSSELRREGRRVGFEIMDVETNRRGILAHVEQRTGPCIGRYRVNLLDLEEIGAKAIINSLERCDVTAIDEIGPMELFSPVFCKAAMAAVNSKKLVAGVIHHSARSDIIDAVRMRADGVTYTVTPENRESLPPIIVSNIKMAYLKG